LLARVRGRPRGSILAAVACLLAAMAMHLQFDAPQPPIEFKVALNLTVVVLLYLLLRTGYLRRVRAALAARAAAGVITGAEASELLSRRYRRRELQRVPADAQRAELRSRQEDILAGIDAEAG
jgi:hypothetical protein